jgi:lipoate synthase
VVLVEPKQLQQECAVLEVGVGHEHHLDVAPVTVNTVQDVSLALLVLSVKLGRLAEEGPAHHQHAVAEVQERVDELYVEGLVADGQLGLFGFEDVVTVFNDLKLMEQLNELLIAV